jgi:hypothetical protein
MPAATLTVGNVEITAILDVDTSMPLAEVFDGSGDPPFPLLAEADGNRTRLGALAPTPVLKTGGPTRHPDASSDEDSRQPSSGIAVPFTRSFLAPS